MVTKKRKKPVKKAVKKSASKKRKPARRRSRVAAKPMSRSLRVYQKVAIVFVVVSLLLLLGVLYLSISSAVIRVTPNEEVVSANVAIEVTPSPNELGQVTGYVVEETFEKGREFQVPEEGGTPVEAKAHGKVTLINETGSQADLVATTRVLSEEGVLFRLDAAVSIPANGQIEAAVSADQPGLAGEIGPSQFTIPGLSADTQQVVYAVSLDSMVGGVEYRRVVTQADLDQAASTLADEILEDAKEKLRSGVNSEAFTGEAFFTELLEKASDTEPGTEKGFFTVSATVKVTAVFYDQDLIQEAAVAALYERVPEGYELASINTDGLQVEIQNVVASQETASLNVYLDGRAVISPGSDTLDLDRFLGVSPVEVKTNLEAMDSIAEVNVSFTPFWLKRIPTLKDHIRIIIEPVE